MQTGVQFNTVVKQNAGHFSSLEQLYLSGCHIRSIDPGAFTDLTDLRWLDLSDNMLGTLVDRTFAGLSLEHLFLNGNRQLVLVPGSFADLQLTSGLYLHDCNMTSLLVTSPAFLSMPRTLWLQNNALRSLDAAWRPLVETLIDFRLDSNPLHCDCRVGWLYQVAVERRAGPSYHRRRWSLPDCASPPEFVNRSITDLDRSELAAECRRPQFLDIQAGVP